MNRNEIPATLLADTHPLGRLPTSSLLLHRNAAVPWFILVPETGLYDVLDLPDEQRDAVMVDCVAVSNFVKQFLGFDKVNFAGLGNVVPQMHLHIIGRRQGDACWPQPVWGNLPEGESYAAEQLREWQRALVKMIDLRLVTHRSLSDLG